MCICCDQFSPSVIDRKRRGNLGNWEYSGSNLASTQWISEYSHRQNSLPRKWPKQVNSCLKYNFIKFIYLHILHFFSRKEMSHLLSTFRLTSIPIHNMAAVHPQEWIPRQTCKKKEKKGTDKIYFAPQIW